MHLDRNDPIIMKTVEVVKQYIRKGKGSQTQLVDSEVNSRTGHTWQKLSKSQKQRGTRNR